MRTDIRVDRLEKVVSSLPRRETKRRRLDLRYFRVISECGTAACALGWYSIKHPKSGLKHGLTSIDPVKAAAHFQITYSDTIYLFWPSNYSEQNPKLIKDGHNSLRGTKSRIRAFIDAAKEDHDK